MPVLSPTRDVYICQGLLVRATDSKDYLKFMWYAIWTVSYFHSLTYVTFFDMTHQLAHTHMKCFPTHWTQSCHLNGILGILLKEQSGTEMLLNRKHLCLLRDLFIFDPTLRIPFIWFTWMSETTFKQNLGRNTTRWDY